MIIKQTHKMQRGISLLSALIAVTIFSIGILGIMKLQGNLLLGVSESKERATAISLALAKIDDLKPFEQLSSETGIFAFDDIASNAGGTIVSGDTTLSGTTYTTGWAVTDYYYSGTEQTATTTQPTPAPVHADFKKVIVTMSWTDRNGSTQSVSMEETLAPINPATAGIAVSALVSLTSTQPSIRTSGNDGMQPTF